MTKTKKILTLAIALILIAASIFFAVWSSVGKKFDYAKYANNVTISSADYLGLAITVDLTNPSKKGMYDAPDEDDVWSTIAQALYALREKEEGSDTKYVQYKDTAIGRFDALYCSYIGYYQKDGAGPVIYAFDGKNMEKSSLQSFLVGAGSYNDGKGAWFADQMIGKIPSEYKYTSIAKGSTTDSGATAVVVAGKVAYIDYSWIRYEVVGETRTEVGNSGKDENTVVDEKLRFDLSNPSDLPGISGAEMAAQLVGKNFGENVSFTTPVITEEVEGVTKTYEYKYNVVVNFQVDEWLPFTATYTYPADSDAKDIYGNSLAGQTVTFEVVVEYYENVPDLTDKFDTDEKVTDESGVETAVKESVITHDDYLNLDAKTDYYPAEPGADDNVLLSEQDWTALETKEHASYDAYLEAEYKAYTLHTLTETYEDNRMYAAADVIWSKILEKAQITYPKRAVKLAYEERLDYYEYLYNESETNEVSNRKLYKNVGAYIEAACKDEMKEKNVTDWKSFVTAEAKESVAHTLLVYHLYGALDLEYDQDAYSEIESMAILYQYYGYGSFTEAQVKEAAMFDCVMEHLYKNASVTWKTVADPAEGDAE